MKSLKSSSFLAGTAVYLLSNILNAAIPFALLPILTRYLSPEEYGEVAMFQTLLGALAAFIGLSMQGAAGRKFYDGPLGEHELKEYIGSCLQILLVTSMLTLIILISLSTQLTEWIGLEIKWILFAVLVTGCTVVAQLRLGQWQVRKEAKSYGLMQVAKSLLNLSLSLVFVVTLGQGVGGRISAQVLAAGLFACLALWLLKRDELLKLLIWRPNYIREILHFGVPLIPHVGGMFLLSSVDRFVINSQLGLSQTGKYMVAVQFATALALVFDAINKAYVPWLFERLKRDDEQEKCQIVRLTYCWYALILCGAGLAFLIGPWLVTFVAGESYAKAGDVIGWLALGQVFGGMYLLVTNYIFFSKRTGLLSLVTISSGLINVGLLLLLIDKFGLEGAAYSFCIAMIIRFLLSWYVAQKRHYMPWFKFTKLFPRVKT
ncbi:polysaccharide biosynthesis protein [Chromohalobacter japonicus]|uniref:Polysaccharide biosynthesis protein n=1 Tax=Chromohalobacter japonicus TaxID=223900 RepID=A0A1Q8T870_9GAMM|nr:oligosaccharide flippase family protein [Chromohalobacter japonicus]OLO09872.1 polysaccharide biosynthesis protein [Chromohalobacter japonicus]